MKFLLPHKFKRAGLMLAPAGILFWLLMQTGKITSLLILVTGIDTSHGVPGYFNAINSGVAIAGFFGFLAGLYFIAFSREPVEDEMIQTTRLESFQFAALVQFVVIIAGFLCMLFFQEPKETGMMLFFIGIVLSFWICFISRFNYIMHSRGRWKTN